MGNTHLSTLPWNRFLRFMGFAAVWGLATVAQAQLITDTAKDPINLRAPAVSADGRTIFYASSRRPDARADDATNLNQWMMTASSPQIQKLTNYMNGGAFAGVVSVGYPGTGEIAVYTALPTGSEGIEQLHIYNLTHQTDHAVDINTTGCVQIRCVDCIKACLRSAHVNDAGDTVLYHVNGGSPLHTVTADGTNDTPLNIYQASVAPSPQRVISQSGLIVFTSAAPFGPTLVAAATNVYTISLGGDQGAITTVTNFSDASFIARDAVISKDGSMITFVSNYSDSGVTTEQIWAVRPDGTGLHAISSGDQPASSPSISDDGAWVTYIQGGDVKYMSTAFGENILVAPPITLADFTYSAAGSAVISGDGSYAVFNLGPNGGTAGAVYRVPTGQQTAFSDMTQVFAPHFLFDGGVVSAAGSGAPVPGSLITAFGANLTLDEFQVATAFPLPTTMNGLSLLVNSDPVPLQAVTAWQINAQLPQSLSTGVGQFTAKYENGATLMPVSTDVSDYAPATFLVSTPASRRVGYSQAAAIHPFTGVVVDADAPASPGDAIAIFVAGMGRTMPPVDAGIASPSDPPAETVQHPHLEIGGMEAGILFSGLAPTFAGLYQVNATLPDGLGSGVQPLTWILPNGDHVAGGSIYVN